MYGYQPAIPKSINHLLLDYNQEDIFSIVFGYNPIVSTYVLSPFRKDNNPGCWFEWYDERLMFKDFAEIPEKRSRDCFQAVKDYFNLPNLDKTAEFIVDYFQSHEINLQTPVYQEKPKTQKKVKELSFKAKVYTDRDRLFWQPFGIKKSELIADQVFSVSLYRLMSKKGVLLTYRPIDQCYAISGFEGRVKIYRPYQKGHLKWATNCSQNDVGGYRELIITDKILIITKSYKDYRVIKNQGYNVIWLQNEGAFPNDEILYDLSIRFEKIFILFDNDQTGIKTSQNLVEKFQIFDKKVTSFHSPFYYLKDPAEIISVKGKEELNKFLWNNCHQ